MRTLAIYVGAAAAEIAGCFALWAVVRNGASTLWLAPGVLSLVLFGWLLTKVDVDFAGRAYAVYGGIYIAASLVWLWSVEGRTPDRWDLIGAGVAIAGALIILYMPRSA
ncbi:MAG: YnfA family protein [Hyphomicrobium sp.]|nr:YnfA family protein [Hyphomicrobium sp.]MBN9265345.1 YnfA family protein [Hyphomicrobium sp.]MBN9278350.1 YnfA family protein [Hyphomicrobium sp.]